MSIRDELRLLVDALPERQAILAKRLLEVLLEEAQAESDPLLRTLANAPIDDEPVTPEEEAAAEEARQQVAKGEVISDADLWRELDHETEKS